MSIPLGILSEAEEKTIVLRGEERTTNALLEFAANTKTRMDVCADRLAPSVSVGVPELKKGMIDMVTRGVKYRYITEITKDNLLYCKELAQYVELRHLDGIRGNFAVNESEYIATAVVEEEAKSVAEIIYSTVRSVVEQHQYLFLALWDKAVPAEHRIREIEQGAEPQRVTVIYDGGQALELYQSLIMSAEKEIKVVFPTANALIRQDKAGILFLLQEAAKKCQVKVLMPNDELIRNFIHDDSGISKRFIEQEERGKATILIVDNKVSLMMELKDDSKKIFHEAIGLSTYSNSKAGVLSYVSMFESLWKQTQLYEELKRNEKMQKEFINTAAHELRTPVQAILGYAELSQIQGSTLNKNEALSKIVKNAKRLQRLTEDVLDVTRIESQTLKLNRRKFDLTDMAATVLDDYGIRIQNGKNLELILLNADKPAFVVADKGRISQVLSNLVSNALKFTKSGTVSVSIDISNDDGKKEFIVSVKDTGTGIDSDIMPRLFTKFVSKSETGTGLGLFISKSIVEAHGGRISAENNPDGKGATFRFSLPEG
ncbi:MAG: HAMP domain-containing histidine kinase [Thermoproteota archaeon]|nr:HAMP domain-containing histidine kinase [Thermoproteota archaeon]